MMIPHVVSAEADKVFVNVLNNQTVALADGDVVVWNTSTPDGVRTTQPATATLSLVVGCADGAIAASAYGLAQAYGYKSTGMISNDTSVSILAGDYLATANGVDYLTRLAAGNSTAVGVPPIMCAAIRVTATTPAAAASGVFLRCL